MADHRPDRLAGVRAALDGIGADALLVTNIHNVSYLTGFTGSSGFVLAGADKAFFITDFRYKTQADEEVKGYETVIHKAGWTDEVKAAAAGLGIRRLAVESRGMTLDTHQALSARFEGVEIVPCRDAVERLRLVKDEDELGRITEAISRAEEGFIQNASRLAPGMTEREAAIGLEFNIRSGGSLKVPFDIIVASGPRAALPHGIASGREMQDGDTVVVDFGGEADGYQCDITRSGVLGEPDRKQAEIYDIVLEAQNRAIEAVRPGAACKDVDAAARDYIASKGYGEQFGHGLGHGVGLEVHEAPSISPMSADTVEAGMVFTIEPGIYVPGWGGFRIEDMVAVTGDGCKVITSLSRDMRL